jgi:hypothetical protein
MKKSLSFLAAAATATVVLLSVPGSAKAQVAFGGTFRGPHGAFSIGVRPFVPRVGLFVPSPFYDQVSLDPDYGYGFYYDSQWIPCIRYGSRWIIAERSVFHGRPVISGRSFAQGRSFRSNRDFGRAFVQRDFGRRDFGRRDFVRRDVVRRDFGSRQDHGSRREGGRSGDRRGWNGRR